MADVLVHSHTSRKSEIFTHSSARAIPGNELEFVLYIDTLISVKLSKHEQSIGIVLDTGTGTLSIHRRVLHRELPKATVHSHLRPLRMWGVAANELGSKHMCSPLRIASVNGGNEAVNAVFKLCEFHTVDKIAYLMVISN